MTGRKADIAIAGGGLAGGLIALALHRADPALGIVIIEAGEALGGNHRWSWFESDLGPREADLLSGFTTTEWDDGYKVVFPKYERRLETSYRSLTSADFHAHLVDQLPETAILTKSRIDTLDADGVNLANGERLDASIVVDCRGFEPSPYLRGGWQVFMGRHLRTERPHGMMQPIIMDAAVEQSAPFGNGHAYRFVYTLPTGENELFIEDTYYADDPRLDRQALSGRIDEYCRRHALGNLTETHSETGVLPVITGGNFIAYQDTISTPGVVAAGARAGFVHPLTSYTLPNAARIALLIADNRALGGEKLAQMLVEEAQAHWRSTRFYRMLGAMLFDAARPKDRYLVFQRFYTLPTKLIERFYAARSTTFDKARVLSGKPPVPIASAIAALLRKGEPMKRGGSA